ncbi:MAG: hypothetical protein A2782_02860 [Candidatus Blackburnbacteria bacterium RIFCSPHIGHO2_01_FULL_43_15b]|uniref:Glycosyltransferase RgtA/B/C/D-like domain-containing protein n=1 Tax=Candidatus Blackburnbacteria bacterium RIFCSPHIGHO2_01_FULL_43_15b TaxID=1797513 RepID=A0A1G1V2Z6_9BACT|nr:MAG: hypothetical protein A2782_02860 [Candidatus Blackburnbacteria bacterium RIFCSPHIGHO2_01_FULL_43_15b]
MRLWQLDRVSVSLFGDELDVGYHAYSILKTGRDYSGNFLPIHFQSLAEWRTPLYLYSVVPTVALFGVSPWGVKLPAAIFGILGVWVFYLFIRQITGKQGIALLCALVLALSPWHVQYSRAGFEVTQLLTLYIAGIYFFLRGLKNGKWLFPSAVFLALTPWAYSTAKLFLPLTFAALVLIWRRDLLKLPRKQLIIAALCFAIVAAPIAFSTVFGGGAQRFNYISIFSDPTMSPEIGFARLRDAKMRNPVAQVGITPTFVDRLFHNKATWLTTFVGQNYLRAFSTEFLFTQGDPNPRHSPNGIGELYKFEAVFLVLGLAYFLFSKVDKKIKIFVFFWILAAPIPAALTRDGGNHATRLFLLLPPLIFLVGYGVWSTYNSFLIRKCSLFVYSYSFVLILSVVFFQHLYWIHYPWDSERWWHAAFETAVKTAVFESPNYDKVIVSNAGEPAMIFFLGWSQFSPQRFHELYQPRGTGGLDLPRETLPNFGAISKLDKYYFGSPNVDLYTLGQVLPDKALYVATAKEVNVNLIQEPERLPKDLIMVKAVAYPSGEPAFFLLTKNTK